jgi:HlyD family secretion protein
MRATTLLGILGVAAVGGTLGYLQWAALAKARVPEALARANGRIEVERVDVSTKIPGRIAEIRVREGDFVPAGSLVVRLDATELSAQHAAAKAAVLRAEQGILRAEAEVASQEASLTLAEIEMKRAEELLQRAVAPSSTVDQRRAQRDVAKAAVQGARAAVGDARAALAVAEAQVAQIEAQLSETEIAAPVAGRVEYKLSQPGAVLGSGGRIVTLLDLSDVFMTIFLPTRDVGRIGLGDEARIVLDAAPEFTIPAHVSFIAAEAQFTPKFVETASERDKLMYRVKLAIDPKLLETYRDYVKAGLTGNGYVRVQPEAVWPDRLKPRLPDAR